MKYLSTIIATFLLISCVNNKQIESFNLTTSQRISNEKSNLRTILQSSPNGWYVEYKPHVTLRVWHLYMKFISDTEVEITSNYNIETTTLKSSIYNIVIGSTTKLLFETYNRNIHVFSDTSLTKTTTGLYGDSAFLFYGKKKNGTELEFRVNRDFENIVKFTRWESETPPDFKESVSSIIELNERLNRSYVIIQETNKNTMEKSIYSGFVSETEDNIKFYIIAKDENTGIVTYPYSTSVLNRFTSRLLVNNNQLFMTNYKSETLPFDGDFNPNKSNYKTTIKDTIYDFIIYPEFPLNIQDYKSLFIPSTRKVFSYRLNREYLPSQLISSKFTKVVSDLKDNGILLPNSSGNTTLSFYYQTSYNSTIQNYILINSEMGVNGNIRIKFTIELKDNYVILNNNGYRDSNSQPKTEEVEAKLKPLKDVLFNNKGWYVINLGLELSSNSNHLYYFIQRDNPTISFSVF